MSSQSDVTYDLLTTEHVNALSWDSLLDILDDDSPGFHTSAEVELVTEFLKNKPISGFLKNSSQPRMQVPWMARAFGGVARLFGC